MKICGLTTSVGFGDLAGLTLPLWERQLDKVVLLTASQDTETIAAGTEAGCEVVTTDVWTQDGAKFWKGKAINDALRLLTSQADTEWILIFDIDIVPPDDFRQQIESKQLHPPVLYGATRHQIIDDMAWDYYLKHRDIKRFPAMPEYGALANGFFQLFHKTARALSDKDPYGETRWKTAQGCDTEFQKKFRRIVLLPIAVGHFGEPKVNWSGRLSPRWR